jgi:hypothetical protein
VRPLDHARHAFVSERERALEGRAPRDDCGVEVAGRHGKRLDERLAVVLAPRLVDVPPLEPARLDERDLPHRTRDPTMTAMSGAPTIDSLAVADDAAAWREVGFEVDADGTCRIGTVVVRIAPPDGRPGILGWSVRGLATDVDGLPTEPSGAPDHEPAPRHRNGVATIDHLVAFTPDRARTAAALEAAGLRVRRLRDEPTPAGGGFQAFFRLGEVILEVIEFAPGARGAADPDAPARFWGLAFGVDSLDRAAELLGDHLSEPRDAVQPGRRIATVRRSAGVGVAMAFMTSGPGAA